MTVVIPSARSSRSRLQDLARHRHPLTDLLSGADPPGGLAAEGRSTQLRVAARLGCPTVSANRMVSATRTARWSISDIRLRAHSNRCRKPQDQVGAAAVEAASLDDPDQAVERTDDVVEREVGPRRLAALDPTPSACGRALTLSNTRSREPTSYAAGVGCTARPTDRPSNAVACTP